MYIPIDPEVKEEWKDWTLILPTVSVGNVGQLTVDIILNQTEACHVGFLHDDSLLPVLGNHPLKMSGADECTLTTSAQVYKDESRKNIYVQIRSPLVRGKRCRFVERVVRWAQGVQFGRILVITSLHSYERVDMQMTGTQLRWLVSPDLQATLGCQLLSGWEWMRELERRPPQERLASPDDKHPEVFLPGSGFAKQLYSECISAGVPVGVLLTFCAEGVNSMDAAMLAAAIHPIVLDMDWAASPLSVRSPPARPCEDVSMPESWKYMFGNTFEQSLFQ